MVLFFEIKLITSCFKKWNFIINAILEGTWNTLKFAIFCVCFRKLKFFLTKILVWIYRRCAFDLIGSGYFLIKLHNQVLKQLISLGLNISLIVIIFILEQFLTYLLQWRNKFLSSLNKFCSILLFFCVIQHLFFIIQF